MRSSGIPLRLASAVLCLYPGSWRVRYGEEFHQLLLDELDEARPTLSWWLNLLVHALSARLTEFGLAGDAGGKRRLDAALRLTGAAVALGSLCGAAMWAQLAVGWQWAAPSSGATRTGLELITGGLVGLGCSGAGLAAASLTTAARGGRFSPRGPRIALTLCLAGVIALLLGAGWIGLSWPGTGGHPWPGRALAPAWLARRAWALTLSLSTYWAHPRQLAGLGRLQIAWMAISPALMVLVACAWRRALGPVELRRLPRWTAIAVALLAGAGLCLVATGAADWGLGAAPGPHGLFAPGAIDVGLLAVTALLSCVCALLVRRIALTTRASLNT